MDDSLDDFFAKKDKSKKKGGKSSKSKFVAADLLPSTSPSDDSNSKLTDQLDELTIESGDTPAEASSKEKKKSKKKREKDSILDTRRKEDEEWNTMEEEKDYSGLRIAAKSLAKTADEDGDTEGQDSEYDDDGQLKPRTTEQGGVWKRAVPQAEEQDETDAVEEVPQPSVVETPTPNVVNSKYVPPSLRNNPSQRTADGDLAPISLKRPARKKVAPNITSQEDFPTLGAAPPPSDIDTTSFERVRGGASTQSSQTRTTNTSQRVETTNMYSLLQGNR